MRTGIGVATLFVVGCTSLLGLDQPEQVELGAICTGSNGGDVSLCPPSTNACATLDGKVDWCTVSCGTGPPASGSGEPMPPAGGDRICETFSSSGTPACALPDDVSNPTMVNWYCAILCGPLGNQDFGACPPGLTCVDTYCR